MLLVNLLLKGNINMLEKSLHITNRPDNTHPPIPPTGMRMNLSKNKSKIAKFPQNRLKMNEIAKFGRQKKGIPV